MKEYCEYHESHGHNIDDCIQLRDAIEQLIREGKSRKYVKEEKDSKGSGS